MSCSFTWHATQYRVLLKTALSYSGASHSPHRNCSSPTQFWLLLTRYLLIQSSFRHGCVIIVFSTACPGILHYPAMSSNLNPPLLCWTVDWTPPLSSTSCLFLSCTGETTLEMSNVLIVWLLKFFIIYYYVFSALDCPSCLGGCPKMEQ